MILFVKTTKAIPFVKKKNSLGIEEDVLDRGHVRCTEWRVDQLFYDFDLCKNCAEMLSIQGDNLLEEENAELKRMLKIAVEDIDLAMDETVCAICSRGCDVSIPCMWQHRTKL